jgi:hypothetical protein
MNRWLLFLTLVFALFTPQLVLAHPGHDHGDDDDAFARSALHACAGWDHWLAALLVGTAIAWRWRTGLLLVVVGTLTGLVLGGRLPMAEPGLHWLGCGILVAALLVPKKSPGILAVFALHAFCSGLAHGPNIGSPVGFLAMTTMMLATGIFLTGLLRANSNHPAFRWLTAGLATGLALASAYV